MKLTLLLLWSLVSTQVPSANCNCQGGPRNGLDPNSSGFSNGYGALNSPCGDFRGGAGGYGGADGYGGGGGGRGCKNCCKDSTCNMYQHYPYRPDNHGYYYFRPYNYPHVWKHQQWVANVGGDPRNPYTKAMFIPVYEQFENTTYEPDHKPSSTLSTLPNVGRRLPDLEKLIKVPAGEGEPNAVDVPAPTPAPPPEEPKKDE